MTPTESDLALAARVTRAMRAFFAGRPCEAFTAAELDRAEQTLDWLDAHASEVDATAEAA